MSKKIGIVLYIWIMVGVVCNKTLLSYPHYVDDKVKLSTWAGSKYYQSSIVIKYGRITLIFTQCGQNLPNGVMQENFYAQNVGLFHSLVEV